MIKENRISNDLDSLVSDGRKHEKPLEAALLTEDLSKYDIILVGEAHTSLGDKLYELELLKKYKPEYLLSEGFGWSDLDSDMWLPEATQAFGIVQIGVDVNQYIHTNWPFVENLNAPGANIYEKINNTPKFLSDCIRAYSKNPNEETLKQKDEAIRDQKNVLKFHRWATAMTKHRETAMSENIVSYVNNRFTKNSPLIAIIGHHHLDTPPEHKKLPIILENLEKSGIKYMVIILSHENSLAPL